jgi:hypothetical protein
VKRVRPRLALAAMLLFSVLVACHRCETEDAKRDQKHQETAVTKTDLVALERLINLPFRPTNVKWSTTKYHKGEDWSLTVLLTFSREDILRLLESPEASGEGRMNVARDKLESWFPPAAQSDYKAQLGDKDTIELVGVQLPGSIFAAPEKSPAIQGRALVLEKYNLVYLGLFTM